MTTRPTFDLRDEFILMKRQALRDEFAAASPLPLVGDFVDHPDGRMRRITRVCPNMIQLTRPGFDAYFYLDSSGLCGFSGSLDLGHPLDAFTPSGRDAARVWFFHHDDVRAHNGVDCAVIVNRWRLAA